MSRISFSSANSGLETFSARQEWTRYRQTLSDSFDLVGITPPSAPYQGTIDGPGPLIPNVPTSRETTRVAFQSGSFSSWNEINQSIDVERTALSFGLSAEWQRKALFIAAATGPVLNWVEVDAQYEERLYGVGSGIPFIWE